jgi:hypothetical protein
MSMTKESKGRGRLMRAVRKAAELAEARAKLGFQPRVKLYDGLVQEWDWMRSLPE